MKRCACAVLHRRPEPMDHPFRLPETAELPLPALAHAAFKARQFTTSVLSKWDAGALADDCTLAVSKLIANSVRACSRSASWAPGLAELQIMLRLTLTAVRVLAEVRDHADLNPARAVAAQLDEDGRGLLLVS